MPKTKCSLVGLGGIAQIAHLPLLSKMNDVELVAVCDIEKSKAKSIAQKYNIPQYYSNYDEMLKNSESECMIVTAPTNFHKELSIKAFDYGLHVLVEKPLARYYEEGNDIVEAAKRSGKKLMIGMNNRFRPDFMMQESFISAKELGDIFYIKTGFLKKRSTTENWSVKKESAGGGVFMDLGIVVLDIALWMLKYPKIRSVNAANYYHAFKSVEDSSFVMLRFDNDATVSLEASWSLLREEDLFYCNVYGTEGSSCVNPLKIFKKMHGTLMNVTPLKIENPTNIFKRSYEYELKHFINAIQNNTGIISGGEEALIRLKITDAIYKSAKTGKEVFFK
ncbi:MAG: gfo/Idh/MocA family oxidoreductase [Ignavibacteriae bacterium]|nr:MAG: gfo/Idh/MocA family oxidoreductase [Ignavibacteriota bacterium]